jgi:N-acetylglucosaminyl-diphospho-decaprenol L-rhamnosyltransferase
MGQTRVSVVVVSYNTRDKLRRCLECIESHHQVVVVDNASSDGSAEMVETEFPHVHLIRNADNVGFGAANNQGIEIARGDLILLLNSDAYAHPGAIDELSRVFLSDTVIAAGGRLLNPDGSLQESAASRLTLWRVLCEQLYLEKIFRWSKLFNGYWLSSRILRRSDHATPVDQVMGACLMMRPVARFDDRYFLYCEDTDLCKRLKPLGHILYAPRAIFTHELGSSSSTNRWLAVARYNRGKELYFELHHGPLASMVCLVLDRIGALLRLIVWGLAALLTLFSTRRLRDQVALFARVLTAPLKGPHRPTRTP